MASYRTGCTGSRNQGDQLMKLVVQGQGNMASYRTGCRGSRNQGDQLRKLVVQGKGTWQATELVAQGQGIMVTN